MVDGLRFALSLRAFVRVAALAASLAIAAQGVGLAPTATAASTVGPCATGLDRTSYGGFIRSRSNPGINGVAGRATVVNLPSCTSPGHSSFGVDYDAPWVLPANIQSGCCTNIVQIGYGRCGADIDCAFGPNDGKQHFAYTRDDNEQGIMDAASWYPNEPVGGRVYGFKITAETNSDGNPVWRYCIRDITMGEAYGCTNRPRHWSSGDLAWFAAETNNTHSQLGHKPDSEHDINMRVQYRRGGDWVLGRQVG